MLVGEGGRILGSVTIGGCVDAQVIEESADVLGKNAPRLLELNLGDEEAWEIGLTCGGTIEVFVEPVTLDRPDADARLLREGARPRGGGRTGRRRDPARRARQRRQAAAPRHGDAGGHARRPVPGPAVRRRGAEALTGGQVADARSLEGVRAFVEVFAPPSILLVVGAEPRVHAAGDARPGARLPHHRDRRPAALRHARALPGRRRPQDRDPVGAGPAGVRSIATTALVLVAHDYKYDLPVLRHALATPGRLHRAPGSSRRGRGHPEPAARGRRRRGGARSACACRSASTWARSRRPRSRSRSWPRS